MSDPIDTFLQTPAPHRRFFKKRLLRATISMLALSFGFASPTAGEWRQSGAKAADYTSAEQAKTGECTSSKDVFLNPFNSHSAHHRPIGTEAEYASDSHPSTVSWLQNPSQSININVGAPWGVSVATTEASDPLYTIGVASLKCDQIQGFPREIKLPREGLITPIKLSRSGCTDGVVVIYDRDHQIPHQIRQYNWNDGSPLGGQYKTWDMRGLGHGTHPGDRIGTSASGVAALFGVLRGDEINDPNKKVEHALQMGLPRKPGHCAMMLSREVVLPAVSGDRSMFADGNNLGSIPYGGLMALLPTTKGGPDLDSLGLTARGKRLAEAVRDYGIYAVDGADCVGIRTDQYVANPSELKEALSSIYPYIRMVLNNDVLGSPTAGGGNPRALNCAFDTR